MNDRARLAITGAVALVALVATVGGHGLGISFGGSSDDETSEAVPEDAVRGDGAIQSLANLRDFDSVNVAGPDDVVITQGKSFSVQARGGSARAQAPASLCEEQHPACGARG